LSTTRPITKIHQLPGFQNIDTPARQKSTMTPNKSPSLVVIGGWLGCNPKHLKPYERLYNSLGFDALSFVASPLCVIDSTISHQNSPQEKIHIPSFEQWPSISTNAFVDASSRKSDSKMQALAWKVLGDIHNSEAEVFIYHSFSNGGCFLWESICQILLLKDKQDCNHEILTVLERLHDKCKGVIFDSCPAWFGTNQEPSSKLWQALQHCTEEERQRVHSIYGARIHTVDEGMVDRNLEYFENLTTFPFDIPQLYLYSKNDDLSRHEYISKLIDIRRSRQKHPVLEKAWERSIHCSHLREHGEDYKKAVKAFTQQLNALVVARL
jgi:hypothetical protein